MEECASDRILCKCLFGTTCYFSPLTMFPSASRVHFLRAIFVLAALEGLEHFGLATSDEICKLIKLSVTSCSVDPVPSFVFKGNLHSHIKYCSKCSKYAKKEIFRLEKYSIQPNKFFSESKVGLDGKLKSFGILTSRPEQSGGVT